jgi:hypothetical protein
MSNQVNICLEWGQERPFLGGILRRGGFLAQAPKRGLKPFTGKPSLSAWRETTPSVLGAGRVLGGRYGAMLARNGLLLIAPGVNHLAS